MILMKQLYLFTGDKKNTYEPLRLPDQELVQSYFDGFEYHGIKIKTKLAFEGQNRYKPMKFEKSLDVFNEFKGLKEAD